MSIAQTSTWLLGLLLFAAVPLAAAPPTDTAVPVPARDLAADLARTTTALVNARGEIARLNADLALRDELLTLGRERNAELFKISNEILEMYRKAGILTGIARREPFVQASRVRLERLVQDYEDRLRAARITEQTLAPSVEQRMARDLGGPPTDNDPSASDPAATDKPR